VTVANGDSLEATGLGTVDFNGDYCKVTLIGQKLGFCSKNHRDKTPMEDKSVISPSDGTVMTMTKCGVSYTLEYLSAGSESKDHLPAISD
jgi:hypothetical protein